MTKPKKVFRKGNITAKLIFYDWGWRENIIYSVTARETEKEKGLMMVSRLKELFGISKKDEDEFKIKIFREFREPIIWKRDDKGQIVSPFKKGLKT